MRLMLAVTLMVMLAVVLGRPSLSASATRAELGVGFYNCSDTRPEVRIYGADANPDRDDPDETFVLDPRPGGQTHYLEEGETVKILLRGERRDRRFGPFSYTADRYVDIFAVFGTEASLSGRGWDTGREGKFPC